MRTAKGFTYGYTEDVEAIDPRLKDYRNQEWEAEKRRAWVAFASQLLTCPDNYNKDTVYQMADEALLEYEKRFKEEGK